MKYYIYGDYSCGTRFDGKNWKIFISVDEAIKDRQRAINSLSENCYLMAGDIREVGELSGFQLSKYLNKGGYTLEFVSDILADNDWNALTPIDPNQYLVVDGQIKVYQCTK